MIICGCNCLV